MCANTQESPIHIGLVEDNPFRRDAITYALSSQPDFHVVFAVADIEHIPSDANLSPTLLLFAVNYPSKVFGENLSLDYWRIRFPQTQIVLLTVNKVRSAIEALVDQQISGYAIQDSVDTNELFDIIRQANGGTQTLCHEAQSILAKPRSERDLSRREIQVIQLLQEVGISNRKLAAHQLEVSPFTINQHLRNMFQKLDVHGVVELIEKCKLLGVIEAGIST